MYARLLFVVVGILGPFWSVLRPFDSDPEQHLNIIRYRQYALAHGNADHSLVRARAMSSYACEKQLADSTAGILPDGFF
jgi:hypothetical protein